MKKRSLIGRAARGFTLLEMMLVVLIIGLLMGVVMLNLAGQSTAARIGTTKGQLGQLRTAINTYFVTNGAYPISLQSLVPTQLMQVNKDGWKEDFLYVPQSADPNKPYTLYSKGPDKQAGTQDDISVWNLEE